jgi:hypothetical protein
MTVQLPDPATEDCGTLRSVLALVGDKWTVLIRPAGGLLASAVRAACCALVVTIARRLP